MHADTLITAIREAIALLMRHGVGVRNDLVLDTLRTRLANLESHKEN